MTRTEFIQLFGLEVYEKVRYIRLLFNAQKVEVVDGQLQKRRPPVKKQARAT